MSKLRVDNKHRIPKLLLLPPSTSTVYLTFNSIRGVMSTLMVFEAQSRACFGGHTMRLYTPQCPSIVSSMHLKPCNSRRVPDPEESCTMSYLDQDGATLSTAKAHLQSVQCFMPMKRRQPVSAGNFCVHTLGSFFSSA